MSQQQWYYQVMGEAVGPYSANEFKALIQNHTVLPETLIRKGDQSPWRAASEVLPKVQFPEMTFTASENKASVVTTSSISNDALNDHERLKSELIKGFDFKLDNVTWLDRKLEKEREESQKEIEKLKMEIKQNPLKVIANGIGCLMVFAFATWVAIVFIFVSHAPNQSSYHPRNGDSVLLQLEENSSLFLAVDSKAQDEFYILLKRKNVDGLIQLAQLGRIFEISNPSTAVVVDSGIMSTKVRVLSPMGYGREGLIANELIRQISSE